MQPTFTEALAAYGKTMLPMHMPGGKRRFPSVLPYALDVTEVVGTDDLHDPHGMIADLQTRIASLWGAQRSFVLVNGSTGGILSAVRATGEGALLLARNCHKSVFNAACLCRRDAFYVLPVNGEILPEDVEKQLSLHPEITTAVITSPTYEGVVSDVGRIAAICHAKGVTLLVDEAHGAHLGFHPAFPGSAVQNGADIVVQSLHKTLPALTQTAVLHCKSQFGDALARENAVFETSSPSFVLMASAGECVRFLETVGETAFATYAQNLLTVRERLERGMKHFRLLKSPRYDIGKLVVLTDGTDVSGKRLADCLREEFAIETEMAFPNGLIAMTSVCDGERELNLLADALLVLDARAKDGEVRPLPDACVLPECEKQPYAVRGMTGEVCEPARAVGRISLESVWAYPPGIPLLLPGERVSEDFLTRVRLYEQAGIPLHTANGTGKRLTVYGKK